MDTPREWEVGEVERQTKSDSEREKERERWVKKKGVRQKEGRQRHQH